MILVALRCVPACLLLAFAVDAAAQPVEPIGPYALDARGALARFKGDAGVAQSLGVDVADMPTRGLGVDLGAHWYPLPTRRVTLGIGGELVVARNSRARAATDTAPAGPMVTTRFRALTPQLSLNFGNHDGWSYLSGGIGTAWLSSERVDQPLVDEAGRVRATNYGGGARWFSHPRVAFTFDVRFWTINAQEATAVRPAHPRSRFMVISIGASFR